MSHERSAKGKARAIEPPRNVDRASSSSLSPPPEPVPQPRKRSRRNAETRICPVCDDVIPLRLISRHTELENQRVREMVNNIGNGDIEIEDEIEEGSSTRRSAARARKTWNVGRNEQAQIEMMRSVQNLKRRRKRRRTTLKDLARDSDDEGAGDYTSNGSTKCPICLQDVHGDKDVVEAHVNSCLAHEEAVRESQRQAEGSRTPLDDYDGENIGNVSGTPGAGFYLRNQDLNDVDADVDVDGDDDFGSAQFKESDIIGLEGPAHDTDEDVNIDGDDNEDGIEKSGSSKSLRELVAEGKVVKQVTVEDATGVKAKVEYVVGAGDLDRLELAVELARKAGDMNALILALEAKVKHLETTRVSTSTSLLCRICLDSYAEPTVSTGCWHTCCRECWLRCLGSTKLCPICKRITAAGDLRRVYL